MIASYSLSQFLLAMPAGALVDPGGGKRSIAVVLPTTLAVVAELAGRAGEIASRRLPSSPATGHAPPTAAPSMG